MSAETILLVVAVMVITAGLPRLLLRLTAWNRRRRGVRVTARVGDEATDVLGEDGRRLARVPNVVAFTRDAKSRPSVVAVGQPLGEVTPAHPGAEAYRLVGGGPVPAGLEGAWEAFLLVAAFSAARTPEGERPRYVSVTVEPRLSDADLREALARDLRRGTFRLMADFTLAGDQSSAKSTW